MNSIKDKIFGKLEHLSENALQEVLNFVEFLESQNKNHQEAQLSSDELKQESCLGWLVTDLSDVGGYKVFDREIEELSERLSVEYVGGVLVVQADDSKNWETSVRDFREERINKFTSW